MADQPIELLTAQVVIQPKIMNYCAKVDRNYEYLSLSNQPIGALCGVHTSWPHDKLQVSHPSDRIIQRAPGSADLIHEWSFIRVCWLLSEAVRKGGPFPDTEFCLYLSHSTFIQFSIRESPLDLRATHYVSHLGHFARNYSRLVAILKALRIFTWYYESN